MNEQWIQYNDCYNVYSSCSYIGNIVERAIALYCDCPWFKVFPNQGYPRFDVGDCRDVIEQELDVISRACGYKPASDRQLRQDIVVSVLRGCEMLRDEGQVLDCCYKLPGFSFGYFAGEIDLITEGRYGTGLWEVKTGYHPEPGIIQISRVWVTAIQKGIFSMGDIVKIGVISTHHNRKWVLNLDSLSREEIDLFFECNSLKYEEQKYGIYE